MILEIRGELDTHARVRAGESVLIFDFANFAIVSCNSSKSAKIR